MHRWRQAGRAGALALLTLGCSCSQQDLVAIACDDSVDCPSDLTCVNGQCEDPGRLDSGFDGDIAPYCRGTGPPIAVGDSADPTCSGRLAERSFRYAICTCDAIVSSHAVNTDSFDSRDGPYISPGGNAGSVGINGGVNGAGDWSVGGSTWVAGAAGYSGNAGLTVGAELRTAARLAAGDVTVVRNAEIGGGLAVTNLDVGGELIVPSGRDISVTGTSRVGETVRQAVNVPLPCDCADGDLVDIAGFVAAHESDNDNAAIGLRADAISNPTDDVRLVLPCGRYYLNRLTSDASVVIAIEGRVALFIGGDVSLNASFAVELTEEAEVDVFVSGNVGVGSTFSLGSANSPARARLYVAGAGTINLATDAIFAGNIYAPRAELVAAGRLEVFGSLFVRRLAAAAAIDVHFDRGVLTAGQRCDPPAACESCGDCPSVQACVEGACTACRDSADCCSPLHCSGGQCVPELF